MTERPIDNGAGPFAWNFCPECGHALAPCMDGLEERPHCERCGRFYYANPIPAACCIVLRGDELLLVQRDVEPCKGEWSLPGGFLELGETAEEGALRELLEETQIRGRDPRLVGIDTHPSPYCGGIVLLAFHVPAWEGTPEPDTDVSAARFFPPDERPRLAFQSQRDLLAAFEEIGEGR